MATFQEITGEHPGARAARRHRWIGEGLPGIKEARDKREAAAFLVGAKLADAAVREEFEEATSRAREELEAARRAREELEATRRGAARLMSAPTPHERGGYSRDRGRDSI